MKTIREWLSELSEPYRSQALENMNNDKEADGDRLRDSLFSAISGAFVWSKSIEGHEYWSDFSSSLMVVKSNRKIAEEINYEICSLLDDADDSEQNFTNEIEVILNKYGSITSILNKSIK
jgi:hypothetical protein